MWAMMLLIEACERIEAKDATLCELWLGVNVCSQLPNSLGVQSSEGTS